VPTVFVASSSEGRPFAQLACDAMTDAGYEPVPWWSAGAFPVGRGLLECLIDLVERVDAALIVCTPDDATTRRGATYSTPAQNVLLEYGLFAGDLGSDAVAILEVNRPSLPSDLDGVVTLRARGQRPHESRVEFRDAELGPKVVTWLQSVDAGSSDGARISKLVTRLAPHLKPTERVSLKAEILRARVDINAIARLPNATLEHLILKYTQLSGHDSQIGYAYTSRVDSYVNLATIVQSSADQRRLSAHLARYFGELCSTQEIRPTLLAVSKTAAQTVLRGAVEHLPFPLVMVSPDGPSRRHPVEGYFEAGDRAVLMHDVALSGHHLVDCIAALRSVGLECDDLVALTRHQSGSRELDRLTKENGITVRTASVFVPEWGRVVCGDHKLSGSLVLPTECELCDVLAGAPSAPARRYISEEELPSEVLMDVADFAVISDVAPLTSGHVLIVPRRHILSCSQLTRLQLESLELLVLDVSVRLRAIYGKETASFEHGLCDRARVSSCGIDHAHLHVLPFEGDLSADLANNFTTSAIGRLRELPDAATSHEEYLLLLSAAGGLIGFPAHSVSQYFRRRVAEAVRRPLWNWNDDIALGTIKTYKEAILELHARWNAKATAD
jgi:diadenosine tetraphosphate (Ap4A) HIT family hydrolase